MDDLLYPEICESMTSDCGFDPSMQGSTYRPVRVNDCPEYCKYGRVTVSAGACEVQGWLCELYLPQCRNPLDAFVLLV